MIDPIASNDTSRLMAIASLVASGTVVGNTRRALVRCVVIAIVTSEAPWRIVVAKVVRVDSLAYILQWLMERGITPYMRTRDTALRKNNPLYAPDRFTYLAENNSYLCPVGQRLNFVGLNVRNRTHAYTSNAVPPCRLNPN